MTIIQIGLNHHYCDDFITSYDLVLFSFGGGRVYALEDTLSTLGKGGHLRKDS